MIKIINKNKITHSHKCHEITNGVFERPYNRQTARSKRVLYLNSFKKWRNIDILIEAAKILKDKNYNIHFDIVGARNDAEFSSVVSEVNRLGVDDIIDVHYFTNQIDQWYWNCGIFILVANHVYANNSLLEAMSSEAVPIISNAPWANRIVENGINGYIVNLGSADDLATKIASISSDEKLFLNLSQKARKTVLRDFSEADRSKKMCFFHGVDFEKF